MVSQYLGLLQYALIAYMGGKDAVSPHIYTVWLGGQFSCLSNTQEFHTGIDHSLFAEAFLFKCL